MKEFLSEEALREYLESDALYQGDFSAGDYLYLVCCKTRTQGWYRLFTDMELDEFMQENMVDNYNDLVLGLVRQAGKRCTVVFRRYAVMSDYVENGGMFLKARGEFLDGVFDGEFNGENSEPLI